MTPDRGESLTTNFNPRIDHWGDDLGAPADPRFASQIHTGYTTPGDVSARRHPTPPLQSISRPTLALPRRSRIYRTASVRARQFEGSVDYEPLTSDALVFSGGVSWCSPQDYAATSNSGGVRARDPDGGSAPLLQERS
jgi:hypothetical protein